MNKGGIADEYFVFLGGNLVLHERRRAQNRIFRNMGAVLNRGCLVAKIGAEVSDDGESLREIPCVASESHGGYKKSARNRLFLLVV